MYKYRSKHKNKSKYKTAAILKDLTIGISTLVLVCFLLSGLTGLIYEILWTRMIVKIIGCTPFAVSIILTVFMGGLGLGSYLASRMIDRVEEPGRLLKIYAILELTIGCYGIAIPGLIIAFKPLFCVLYNQLFNYFLFYNVLTLIGCVIIFLIPVTCMGATLPVLCRFYVTQLGHLGTRVGRLYALNTIGAALGSLLCGFWLINLWGVWGTLWFVVLLNTLIGGSCLLVSYQMKIWPANKDNFTHSPTDVSKLKNISHKPTLFHSSGDRVVALLIFAISGFCAMAYEVIWTRLLGLIIGPTTYSFTIVLATFIIGLALGSLIFGWFADKTKKPLWFLIISQIVAAFLALGVSQLLGSSQFLFAKLIYHFKDQFAQLALIKAGILFGFMLGPTLCLGATFPLVGKIYTQSLAKVGKSLGFAYAVNTLGAVLGSFCAGFLLIPWFGKEQSLSLVVGVQLLTSLVIGGYLLREKKAAILRWIPLGVTALIGLTLCCNFPYWNRQLLSIGRYCRLGDLSSELKSSGWMETLWLGTKILTKYQSNSELSYYGDGIGGFTTVVKLIDALGTPEYVILNSGKGDASSRTDMTTQTLSAHLPLLFHPDPKEIMVLGLASGITAGEVLHYPIEKLDIIEISEEVVSASNFFIPWNNKVLSHPKTELIIQDGRAHLELTKLRYDIIISEPSNPWMAGLAGLFTREFFHLAKKRLRGNGIFVQFFHSYQMDWSTFALVGRTFSQVFPNSLIMTTSLGGSDYLMIGFKGENRLMVNNADKKISYAHRSKNITLPNSKLLYRLIVSEDLKKLCGTGPVHSDNWPHLEFAAPKQMHKDDPNIEINIRSKGWLSQETRTILREIANVEDQIAYETFALSVYKPSNDMVCLSKATFKQKERFFKIMEDYCARSLIKDYSIFTDQELKEKCLSAQIETLENNIHLVPDKSIVYNHLGYAYRIKGELLSAIECYQKSLATNPESTTAHINLGRIYSTKGMVEEAISEYQKVLAANPNDVKTRNNLGELLIKQGNLDEGIEHFKKCLVTKLDYEKAHNNLGTAYIMKDMLDEAIKEFERALVINPNYTMAHTNLGNVYLKKGELDKAIAEYKKTIAIKSDYANAHNNLALAYYYKGNYKLAIIHCDKAVEFGVSVNPKLLELLKPYH